MSQNHAARLAQTLNVMADLMFPGRYASDFAVQVTSQVQDAQQFTINFANNLLGSGNFLSGYRIAEQHIVEQTGQGVVCFISNYSWLNGLSFTGIREAGISKHRRRNGGEQMIAN